MARKHDSERAPSGDAARDYVEYLTERFEAEAGSTTFPLKRAAAMVGFAERTLSRAIASGALRVSRPGGKVIMVTARRLAEWVADGEKKARR